MPARQILKAPADLNYQRILWQSHPIGSTLQTGNSYHIKHLGCDDILPGIHFHSRYASSEGATNF